MVRQLLSLVLGGSLCIALVALIAGATIFSSHAQRMKAKMNGADYTYGSTGPCQSGDCVVKGRPAETCSGFARICAARNEGSPMCETSREECMQTGAFRGPRGRVFSGLSKR
jgi:hypothetical protein